MQQSGIKDYSNFIANITQDSHLFRRLVENLSINVSSMFRDPPVFAYLRNRIIPALDSYPHIRIWCAGVATGLEAYSLAILLHELGLLDKSLIYATDFNPAVVERAKNGAVPQAKFAEYTKNYHESGGREAFSEYFTLGSYLAHIDAYLLKKVLFSTHNLLTGGVFNEFQLILCRNTLIYFDNKSVARVLKLFHESLSNGGHLCLGKSESIRNYTIYGNFEPGDLTLKIYRKKGQVY